MLWLRVPRQSDLNILYQAGVDKAELARQLARLWHGEAPLPERVQSFGEYAVARGLPLKWPFVTYFLFLLHPDAAMFVKPTISKWFLQFAGQGELYGRSPSGVAYEAILALCQELLAALAPYGARDMIDVQSIIWVAAREAQGQTGRLTPRGQIELDVPDSDLDEEQSELGEALAGPAELAATTIIAEPAPVYQARRQPPTQAELAETLCLPATALAGWLSAIHRKKQAILQGPPGTGKTFAARLLAEHLVGTGDGFVELLQFHPTYAYEDFMQGIRPVPGGGFELVEGRFLAFCRRAAACQGPAVLILDEMNRAPLARVFGELMYLLEYREAAIPLAGGGQFAIPGNVFILGTMNTADRSIALVDFALRRRFAFLEMRPNYELLRQYHADAEGVAIEALISQMRALNQLIDDPSYALGVTFFLVPELAAQLPSIWQTEIEPYLAEYFFDRPERLDPFRWEKLADKLLTG
ncbi:MAG: AAA family ATPase [Ardenticatenales bacterium]|nr:AAA family ATPase [Ardenticatenales bacterium]